MFQRRAKRFDRQREDLFGEAHASARGQRRVGDERGGAGRAVDQRPPLLDLEIEARRQLGEQRIKREDLARPALTGGRHYGHRSPVEHRSDGERDPRRRRRMPLQEVRQPSQYDASHHAIGQRISERRRRSEGFDARVTVRSSGPSRRLASSPIAVVTP